MVERLYETTSGRTRYRVTKREFLAVLNVHSTDPADTVVYPSASKEPTVEFSTRDEPMELPVVQASFTCPACAEHNSASMIEKGEKLYCTSCGAKVKVFKFKAIVDTIGEDE